MLPKLLSNAYNPNCHCKNIYNYIKLNNQGTSYLLSCKYNEALESFEKALCISKKLQDQYKIYESQINIGIVYFFKGILNEAVNYIKPCYEYMSSECCNEEGKNSIQDLCLYIKSSANLLLLEITINSKNKDCISYVDNIINILSKEKDMNK